MAIFPFLLRSWGVDRGLEARVTQVVQSTREPVWQLVGGVVAMMGPTEVEAYTLAHARGLIEQALSQSAPEIPRNSPAFERIVQTALPRVVAWVADRARQARDARLRRMSA